MIVSNIFTEESIETLQELFPELSEDTPVQEVQGLQHQHVAIWQSTHPIQGRVIELTPVTETANHYMSYFQGADVFIWCKKEEVIG
ncbi:hypothetical protein LCGC14_0620610 [marine sediment metagenome]|uniref:Uncharacterized protein n=1 Tax=marine sediment metagenome TaxID=412755 RepID=A0A0F9UDF5_9ZZZZ